MPICLGVRFFETQCITRVTYICRSVKDCDCWTYTLCLKNDTDIAHYNFDADQPILNIFVRDVAERVYAIKR